ncbi:hypothetical protein Pelo_11756 [Pelomyxa schiedti]|nr:hypothetical protein Pelo_11756 [Pelomyxa schiedti]
MAPEQAREPCPKKPREEVSFIHCHDDVAKSTVSRAFAYLDKLAFEAETSTRRLLAKLRIKHKEISRTHLRNSGTSMGFYPKLFYHKDWILNQLHQALKNTLSHIFIVSGTHILSLPHLVLVQIVGYLPRESILAVRSVCFDFWKAVCEATRHAVTLCTSVARQDNSWLLIDYNGACTPTADFCTDDLFPGGDPEHDTLDGVMDALHRQRIDYYLRYANSIKNIVTELNTSNNDLLKPPTRKILDSPTSTGGNNNSRGAMTFSKHAVMRLIELSYLDCLHYLTKNVGGLQLSYFIGPKKLKRRLKTVHKLTEGVLRAAAHWSYDQLKAAEKNSALHLTDTDLQLAGKSSANAQKKAISDWAAKTGNMETTKTAVASIKEKQAQAVPQHQPHKHRPSASQVAPIPKETATAPQPKRPRKRTTCFSTSQRFDDSDEEIDPNQHQQQYHVVLFSHGVLVLTANSVTVTRTPAQAVSCGGAVTLILSAAGEVFSCGGGGSSGPSPTPTFTPTPTPSATKSTPPTKSTPATKSAPKSASSAQANAATPWACQEKPIPWPVVGLYGHVIAEIACGGMHCLAIEASPVNDVWMWGEICGKPVAPTVVQSLHPSPETLSRPAHISAGGAFSVVVCSDDSAFSWGTNSKGQLGLGDTKDRETPQQVRLAQPIRKASCGGQHVAYLTEIGAVFTCGSNRYMSKCNWATEDNK